jgi:hypothetical protein
MGLFSYYRLDRARPVILGVRSLVQEVRSMTSRAVAMLLCFASLLASLPTIVLSAPRERVSLIGRSDAPCAGYDCLQEFLYPIAELPRRGEGVFLVRIDSDLPLAFAIATASVPLRAVTYWLGEAYGVDPANVLVGRGRPMAPTAARFAATELWWAASREELPAALDRVNSTRVIIDRLGVRSIDLPAFEGSPDYIGAIQQLVTELRRRPNAIGIVNGYYIYRTTRSMSRRLRQCERLLANSGLDRRRFVVRHIRWTGGVSIAPQDPQPVRPSVFLYEILPEEPVPPTARSNYRVQLSAHNGRVRLTSG